ncbi:MAG TPA: SBBP repeat-containing protein, partial [Terracidiphilus sp.]
MNYFLGNDSSKWRSNISLYGRVTYRNIYPGVNLAFHGAGKDLEFDYVVSAGADASPIAVSFEGAESMRTDEAGDLILATSAGPVQLHKPVAYQSKNGARQPVDARFAFKGKNQVAFELGPYDHSRELVIDPTVTYSTYFGGDFADYGISVAVDASGNSYVAGATDSDTIPGPSGSTVAPNNNGSGSGAFDTFVTEIGPTGACIFTTFFGGTNDDFPGGIAIDSQGVYISGTTDSSDFPATAGAAQTVFLGGITNGANDAYAVELSLTNGSLLWGTFIGGTDSDSGLGVAVDSAHNVYVVGETYSQDLGGALGGVNPLPNGSAVNLNSGSGDDDGYIVKLNAGGASYALVSYIGGSSGDLATGVALDGSGNIYVAGETISTDLPTTAGVIQPTCGTDGTCNNGTNGPLDDAFVVSIKADLSNYNYVTYYGGSNFDDAFAIAADSSGNAFITGTTASTDLLSAGTTFQSTLLGAQNAFILELNGTATAVTYNTYFGGDGTDLGLSVAVDPSDNVYLTGQTSSSDTSFPLLNATQPAGSGSTDAFVSVLGLSQGQLLFSTFLGGGGDEDQFEGAVAVDPSQNIYVVGDTDSGNGTTAVFPTTAGAISTTYGGGTCMNSGGTNVPCTDAFVAAYSPATAPDFTVAATSPAAVNPGSSGSSTITLTALNGYALPVNLTCTVSGTGAVPPVCSASSFSNNPVTPSGSGATTTLTITTTAPGGAAMVRHAKALAIWLPVVGISILGIPLVSARARRKKTLGILLLFLV